MDKIINFNKNRSVTIIVSLIILIIGFILWGMGTGYTNITTWDVLRIITGNGTANEQLVVYQFRLPRLVMASLVGAGLATSGCLLQSLTRNGLADPGILGINVGAGVMMVLIYRYLPTIPATYPLIIPFISFIGAFLVAIFICWLATTKDKGLSALNLILMGIAVAAAGNAFILVTSLRLDRAVYDSFSTWYIGNISGVTWLQIRMLYPWTLILIPVAIAKARTLDALALGNHSAISLGIPVVKEQLMILMIAVGLAAASVSVAGGIGFIGLIAPHIAKRLVGPSHKYLMITTSLIGALLVIIADTLTRIMLSPLELPVGIVITVIGTPYFLYLIRKANS